MKGILWAVLQDPIGVQPLFSNGNPHHCTLVYGANREDWDEWIGREFDAEIYRLAANNRIQAFGINLPSAVPFTGKVPHITISWADGVTPVESADMLLGAHWKLSWQPVTVKMKVEFLEWKS